DRRHAAAHQHVVQESQRLGKSQGQEPALFDLYKRFMDEFPDSEYAPEFRRSQSEARDKWDERIWEELQQYQSKSTDAVKLKQRVDDYLAIGGAPGRVDAWSIKGAAEGALDKGEYTLLLERARVGQEGPAREATDAIARQYLGASRGVKRM